MNTRFSLKSNCVKSTNALWASRYSINPKNIILIWFFKTSSCTTILSLGLNFQNYCRHTQSHHRCVDWSVSQIFPSYFFLYRSSVILTINSVNRQLIMHRCSGLVGMWIGLYLVHEVNAFWNLEPLVGHYLANYLWVLFDTRNL